MVVGMRMRAVSLCLIASALGACSHELEVKNLRMYATPRHEVPSDRKPSIAIVPFAGTPDEIFYYNALIERLSQDGAIGQLHTDYIHSRRATPAANDPDLVLSITPKTEYRSSGWNFLINWPGFLIFTPAWNGYVYYADISTTVDISDRSGRVLSSNTIPISYSIREAEMDRTIFTGLTWLEVSALAFGGGIYNANVFDRDIVGSLEAHVKDNYTNYVYGQIGPKIAAAADETMAPAPAPTPVPEDAPATPPAPELAPAPEPAPTSSR
jgi:hypothetical protein